VRTIYRSVLDTVHDIQIIINANINVDGSCHFDRKTYYIIVIAINYRRRAVCQTAKGEQFHCLACASRRRRRTTSASRSCSRAIYQRPRYRLPGINRVVTASTSISTGDRECARAVPTAEVATVLSSEYYYSDSDRLSTCVLPDFDETGSSHAARIMFVDVLRRYLLIVWNFFFGQVSTSHFILYLPFMHRYLINLIMKKLPPTRSSPNC